MTSAQGSALSLDGGHGNIVSPVPCVSPPEDAHFPGYLTCPITQQPPEDPVYLQIPSNGKHSLQVFERSALYRQIATTGTGVPFWRVCHAMNLRSCDRRIALSLVTSVPSGEETPPNDAPEMRSPSLGNVAQERVEVDIADDVLVEGEDDVAERHPAPRRGRGQNVTVHRSQTAGGFAADSNTSSTRFLSLQRGYDALRDCTRSLQVWIDREPLAPPCSTMGIARDHMVMFWYLNNPDIDQASRFYFKGVLQSLQVEGNTVLNQQNSNNNNNDNNNENIDGDGVGDTM